MIENIATTVIGALLLWAIFAYLKSHRLYVIAPKLCLNTPISDGQIVSLSIFNGGFISEEDVALSFRPACKFELIATSKSTLSITGNTLSISKLSRLETVTVLLLIEGKTFDSVDIESIESKKSKGRVVESKEKATTVLQSILAIPFLLLFLCVPFLFGTSVGAEMKMSAMQYINEKFEIIGQSKQLAGFNISVRENYGQGNLKGALENSYLVLKVHEVVRRDDILIITLNFINNTAKPLIGDGYLESSAGNQGPLSFWDSRVEMFALAPKETKQVKLKIFLPEKLSVKIVQSKFSFKNMGGDEISTTQIIEFN